MLSNRFGNENLVEKHRTELRTRRRKSGESLSVLCQDIRRLLILSYPGPTSAAHEAIAKDSFIDALDEDLGIKVREQDPASLDEALRIATRLEAIHQAAATRGSADDVSHRVGKHARGVFAASDQSAVTDVLAKLNELQHRFDSELKSISCRMSDIEAAVKRTQPQHGVRSTTGTAGPSMSTAAPSSSRAPRHGSSAGTTAASYGRFVPTSAVAQKVCYRCGDSTHLMRNCTAPRQGVRGVSDNTRVDLAAARDATTANTRSDVCSVEAPSCGLRGPVNGHVYIEVRVRDRRHLALVDSGCELSLAPNNMVDVNRLQPTTQRVFAANGTPINVVGETDVHMNVNGKQMSACVLVSPDVSELMLGIRWLEEKRAVWNFRERSLNIDGISIPLQSKESAKMCWRVYVQDVTVSAPRIQTDVPVSSTVNRVSVPECDDQLIEARHLRPWRTVSPAHHREVAVQGINTTSKQQEVSQELYLENLEEPIDTAEVCSNDNAQVACVSTENRELRSLAEIAELQRSDTDVGPIVRMRLQSDEQPPFDSIRAESKNTKIYWAQWPRLVVRDGVVYRITLDKAGRPSRLQLLVPTSLRSEMIDCVHNGLTGSHSGVARTMTQLFRGSWWSGWRSDFRRQLKRCSRCSPYHRGRLSRHGQLQRTLVGDVSERLSVDLMGPHMRSRQDLEFDHTETAVKELFDSSDPRY